MAGDNLVRAQSELERLPAVDRAVELFALGAIIGQPAGIVHGNLIARGRRSAVLGFIVGVFQSIRHLDHLIGRCVRPAKRRDGGDDGERHGGAGKSDRYHDHPCW